MGVFDSMLVKYGAVMVGFAVLGLPVFGPNKEIYLKKLVLTIAQLPETTLETLPFSLTWPRRSVDW